MVEVTGGHIPARMNAGSSTSWLVLTHGAGGTIDDPLTAGLASRLRARGLGVLETTFLYRAEGRRMPDRMIVLERTLREVTDYLVKRAKPARLFLGGKSMGGRVAARIAKTVPSASGVCLLSYPLHPPSKITEANLVDRRETLRTIGLPTFVAQGTNDPFGGPTEIAQILPAATLFSVEGGDHDLAITRGVVSKTTLDELATRLVAFIG